MRLVHEQPHRRIYEAADGTIREVRPEVRGQRRGTRADTLDELPELKALIEAQALGDLELWFRWHPRLQPFGESEVAWSRGWVRWTPGLVDRDGEPVEEFEDCQIAICTAERGYWPAAPEEQP